MAYSERELIARLVQCEAGEEGDNGMRAVATVVINRTNASIGEYARISNGGNIRNIIFQQGQFDCTRETIRNEYNPQNIYNMNPTDVHYEIADWALSGNKLGQVGECLWFLNPYSANCMQTFPYNGSGEFFTRINEHCFYTPTQLYANT